LTKRVQEGKPEEKRPFGRPKCRGENNINPLALEMDIKIVAHHLCKM
jgi:hypothetical protein